MTALELMLSGLQGGGGPALAEMMPATASAAGGGAALPLAGGAAALAALGAGGVAVNDMVVGRQRDPGGLLESLRAAAERDPRALPLYERELRRMGGTPPAPGAAPAKDYTSDMWPALTAAKNALTQKSPSSLPASRGPAGNRVGAAAPDATFEALMTRTLASAEAEAGLLGKAAADTKVSDWANKRREFDKTNVLNVPDPMNSRAISDAMIAFGGKLLASEGRDVGGGVQEGGKAWMAGRNRNEDQASKERDFRLKSFMDTMGLEQKDVESLTAKDKAVLAAAISGIQAKDVDVTSRLDERKRELEAAMKERELANRLEAARIGAPDRSPGLNTVAGGEWLLKRTPEERAVFAKGADPEKFNKDKVAEYRSMLERATGKGANEAARNRVELAFDAVLGAGGTPEQAYNAAVKSMKPK